MADKDRARSEAREARIVAAAIEIEVREQAKNPDAAGLPTRYEVRRDGGGWAVFDLATGRYARRGEKTTAGLSRGRAEEEAYELQRADNEARFRAAINQSGRRP